MIEIDGENVTGKCIFCMKLLTESTPYYETDFRGKRLRICEDCYKKIIKKARDKDDKKEKGTN